ncbi:restriction endonuclease subunit S [Thioalkalivibrio denitrificans]|uniref:restriction endonuclease subunit S n=1 Tax=Thioalkalivibrio denitrificans TaxID=108003 RepID=UPI00158F2F08|nr:restriction endonuclease subunit S [Thioalkalivibrio denitrificans]
MSEWRQIAQIADTNPETLGVKTESDYRFRYIDLGAVEEGIVHWDSLQEFRFAGAPSRARRRVQPGDVLFGTVRPNLRSHGYVPEQPVGELVASTGFSVIRPRDGISDGKYLFFSILGHEVYAQSVNAAVGSNYPAVNDRDVRQFRIFAPPLEEQKKIAQILDSLDTQIRRTEALIAKLERIKQGLLTDLLTRGIDQNGQLRPAPDQAPHLYKDSPLGRIPKSWHTRSLGETLRLQRGFDITVASQTAGDYPVVSSSGITSYHNQYMVKGPGVVTGRKGKLGLTHYIESNFWPHDTSLWVKDFHGNNKKFAVILLDSLRLGRFDAATSVPTLNRNFVHPLLVSVPPVDEQNRIVEMKARLDARTAKERRKCERLRTLRTGLMDDLLTGRVRVTPLLGEAQQRKV